MRQSLDVKSAAEFIATSERTFHGLRKSPTFPLPILIGGRLRWIRDELDAWLRVQPRVTVQQPEPQQLRGSAKRAIEPRPEVWPVPRFASLAVTGQSGEGP